MGSFLIRFMGLICGLFESMQEIFVDNPRITSVILVMSEKGVEISTGCYLGERKVKDNTLPFSQLFALLKS
jgi:hypothetical protein